MSSKKDKQKLIKRNVKLLELRHMQYFVEVVKQKSMTKAASSLFITQPTISNIIKLLEEGSFEEKEIQELISISSISESNSNVLNLRTLYLVITDFKKYIHS